MQPSDGLSACLLSDAAVSGLDLVIGSVVQQTKCSYK